MDPQTRSLDRYEPARSNSKQGQTSSSSSTQPYGTRSPVVRRASGVISSSTHTSGHPSSREQSNETSISVHVWHPSATTSSGASTGHSALAKTPLLRDVPQVKRKLTSRRDRDSMAASMVYDSPGSNINSSPSLSDPRSFVNKTKHAAPSWLREKPSRAKLTTGLSHKAGSWRKATLTMRDTGVMLILGEDRAMLHSISTSDLLMSDVRLVDDSLFGRPYILGIFARPSTLTATARAPAYGLTKAAQTANSGGQSNTGRAKDEPIFICFPNSRKLYSWRSLFRTFSRAEMYGPANSVKPIATHRCYRQIDMTIHEMRLANDRTYTNAERVQQRSSGIMSPAPPAGGETDESGGAMPSGLPHEGTAAGATSTSQHGNYIGRASMEVSAKAISSVMERLNLGGPSAMANSSTESTLLKHNEDADDSKSMTSTDSIVAIPPHSSNHLEGPNAVLLSSSAPIQSSVAPEMDRRPSDGSLHNVQQTTSQQNLQLSSSCCQVYMDGEVIGRTRICSGTSSIAWYDKFSFQDLPFIGTMHVEVLQAWRPGKFVILGYVDLPVETMRRGENVEGWYPIWGLPRLEDTWSRRDERSASYTREVVGEVKLAVNIYDETVLAGQTYADIKETLNGDGCVPLVKRLCKELEEVQVISLLVDVYTADGTIVERLADLTKTESANFASEPALLFRGNSLLSRALDKFQRRYCLDWLEACVGTTVRKVCSEKIKVEPGESSPILMAGTSSGGGMMGSASATSGQDEASLETLRSLSQTLWHNIYANRHKCPADLRRALSVIRRTVNKHFNSMHGPGVQGVGAFIFLRLICPAITSPNLYGLMGTAPEQSSVKTLMLLAKVFLALANKRQAFDKDKEPWLVKMNDFLQQHASAYDDFITIVSSEPDEFVQVEAWGDERDTAFQRVIRQRAEGLPTLHREAIARSGIRLDASLAMASLVSYVVRGASTEPYADQNGAGTNADEVGGKMATQTADGTTLVNDFVDMCCDIEDLVGYHLDRAGYNPEPLTIATPEALNGVHRTTSVFTANKASPSMASVASVGRAVSPTPRFMLRPEAAAAAVAVHSSPPSVPPSQSTTSVRARRATVAATASEPRPAAAALGEEGVEPKMSYIGQDSFLRGQIPHALVRGGSGDGGGLPSELPPLSTPISPTTSTSHTDSAAAGHRRQSASLGRQISNTLRSAGSSSNNTAADYRSPLLSPQQPIKRPTPNRSMTLEHESDEDKKKRNWWRRKK